MVERFYVYAIAASDASLPTSITGFGGPVFVLLHGELGAVVSQIRAEDVNDGAPTANAENLLRHEAVVEAACAAGRALPVRFGTTLADGAAVTHALAEHYDALRDDLSRIGDKVEMGVSILWQPAGEGQDAATVGPDAASGKSADAGNASQPGLAYLRARQAVYQRHESARARAQALARELDTELRPYTLQCIRSVCPSERLALRDVYLLERTQVSEFERTVDEARRRRGELRFLVSGPWPPYSFVTSPAQRDAKPDDGARISRMEQTGAASEPARTGGSTGA